MCARGEALGGRLIAWSGALLAMAWDTDSIEEALLLATSIREESLSPGRAWSSGMAEGELEQLAPDGARMQLAWGEALISAASLARVARSGEVLVDGDVRALRAGQLSLLGARAATDAGQRVRGWRLDPRAPLEARSGRRGGRHRRRDRPLHHPPAAGRPCAGGGRPRRHDAGGARPRALRRGALDLRRSSRSSRRPRPSIRRSPPRSEQRRGSELADRVRRLATGDESTDAVEALAELRRTRARAEGGPPAARCQAALALAMTLAIAGRPEEALLEAVDALARAREAHDPKAVGACMALLAKLYAGAGRAGEAAALRESSGVG